MSTTLVEREAPARPELIEWRKQDAAIAKMAEEYLPLKVNGIDDKKGLSAVHEARMEVKNTRIAVEKKRVELKADALEYGRAVDKEAKRLAALLAPIEEHLEAEEQAVVNERERIKREAEEAKRAKLKQRFDALQAAGYAGNMMTVPEMDDKEFASTLLAAQADKAERDRLADEQRQRQEAEAERLKKLEAEAAAARAKQEAEAAEKRRQEEAALAAERSRLAEVQRKQDEEAARLRAEQQRIELEKAKAEAAERARVETEQRIARQQAEAKAAAERKAAQEKADAEAREAARLQAERERPHREKLLAVADAVGQITVPKGPKFTEVVDVLKSAAAEIRDIAKGQL